MQYIEKRKTQPIDWEIWFTTSTGRRTYDYKKDVSDLHLIRNAKQFLIDEQNGYCAYCNQEININNASIEHVIPKELNIALSTSYHNLVAVCKTPLKDPHTGLDHCDKTKGSQIITPFIFFSNCDVIATKGNAYFKAKSDGTIEAKVSTAQSNWYQAQAFIDVLNLNHSLLKENRAKDVLGGLLLAFSVCSPAQKGIFWKVQFKRILQNKKIPYRQFLLIYIAGRLGIN